LEQATMSDAVLLPIVLGMLLLALGVDVARPVTA
jgi:hypothetical protein